MKNMLKTLGAIPCIALIAFVAVIGFSTVSCESDDHDPDANPAKFYGAWTRAAVPADGDNPAIPALTLTFKEDGSFSTGGSSGHYATTGLNKIKFRMSVNESSHTYKYKFIDDTTVKLTASSNHDAFEGTFTNK